MAKLHPDMQSRRNISGTLLAIILVLFGVIGLLMSVPVGSAYEVRLGARTSVISLIYGFLQTFYILMRPSFSAPCPENVRLLKTGGYALSALGSAVNLILSVTVYRSSESEDIVQASSAALALFHGGLYWAYTRMTTVFLPFFYRGNHVGIEH